MVDLLFTVEPSISSGTLAEVTTIWVVSTASTIKAWPIRACHGTKFTILPIEARWTGTAVGVLHVSAASSVAAGVSSAFVDLDLTAGS